MSIKKFYKNNKILVTGGAGFIGSHLVESLLEKKHQVTIFDKEYNPQSYLLQNKLHKKCRVIKIDIRDKKKIKEIIRANPPDYIFHLAAQTTVTEAYQNPVDTLESNILGTIYLLEEVRKNSKIKGMIIASSDKAYGKSSKTYLESSPLKGDHPYDVSKSSADLISQTYFKTYQTPIVIARFGNIYGEGDLHLDRIIPGICEAIIKKQTLKIRSNGKYVRDYLYVKDVINGYLILLKNLNEIKGEAFNFSSQENFSVLDLIALLEKILSQKIPYEILNSAYNEIPYQHLDDTKIRKLGWKNQYVLNSTIKNIVNWYRQIL